MRATALPLPHGVQEMRQERRVRVRHRCLPRLQEGGLIWPWKSTHISARNAGNCITPTAWCARNAARTTCSSSTPLSASSSRGRINMALEIYAYKCKKCGQLHYPYRMVCKKCGKNDVFEFDTEPLPRKGKLLTFTTVYNLPPDFNVAKLGLGIVELENGMRITGQIKITNPKLGMAVTGKIEIVREAEYSKNYGMVFYPA